MQQIVSIYEVLKNAQLGDVKLGMSRKDVEEALCLASAKTASQEYY